VRGPRKLCGSLRDCPSRMPQQLRGGADKLSGIVGIVGIDHLFIHRCIYVIFDIMSFMSYTSYSIYDAVMLVCFTIFFVSFYPSLKKHKRGFFHRQTLILVNG
jgi:hypothetical protein